MRTIVIPKPSRPLVVAGAAVAAAAAAVAVPRCFGQGPQVVLNAPFAAGTSAGNIQLGPGPGPGRVAADKRVLIRWVARGTGLLRTLYLELKSSPDQPLNCPTSANGYGGGSSGIAEFRTYRVKPNGLPLLRAEVGRTVLSPCTAAASGSVAVPLDVKVRKGDEFATVVRNADPDPRANYFSVNFLYQAGGVLGANGRNERSPHAKDVYYGLDPRELVGFSADGGRHWQLPIAGAPYLPTYVEAFADGRRLGQPYLYPNCPCPGDVTGTVTMVFPRAPKGWTIRALGAYTLPPGGQATVDLLVDGSVARSASLAGIGMLRASIDPLTVPAGATVAVRTTAGADGLALQRIDADTPWKYGPALRLGRSWKWYFAEGTGGGDAANAAVTVYPLPFYGP